MPMLGVCECVIHGSASQSGVEDGCELAIFLRCRQRTASFLARLGWPSAAMRSSSTWPPVQDPHVRRDSGRRGSRSRSCRGRPGRGGKRSAEARLDPLCGSAGNTDVVEAPATGHGRCLEATSNVTIGRLHLATSHLQWTSGWRLGRACEVGVNALVGGAWPGFGFAGFIEGGVCFGDIHTPPTVDREVDGAEAQHDDFGWS